MKKLTQRNLMWWFMMMGQGGTESLGYSSGEVGNVDTTTLVVTFTKPVAAAGNDYSTGVSITVAGAGVVISSGTRQADTRVVHYVIGTAVAFGDAVTWAYNGATGHITDAESVALASVTAQVVTNNVASASMGLVFNLASNSQYLVMQI